MPDPPVNVVVLGDSREVLKTLPDCSVDSVVTDPPAGIAFMGKDWDNPEAWKYPVTEHGFTDGGVRVPAPAIGSSGRNPNCRKCRRHKRGWKDVLGCECEKPDFDDQQDHLKARALFVGWLTQVMRECFRVLKPGGHMLVWSIPRTSHWTATAIEDAGFEIRDAVHHIFGQGFPKSLNIGKAIDKMAGRQFVHVNRVKEALQKAFEASGKTRSQIDKECGFRAANYLSVKVEGKQPDPWFSVLPSQEKWAKMKVVLGLVDPQLDEWFSEAEREVVAYKKTGPGVAFSSDGPTEIPVTAPATPEAQKWDGWGTQLKPAVETWWLCRKPIEAQNVAAQVLATGTGGINIDGARIGGGDERKIETYPSVGDQGCINRPGETSHSGEAHVSRVTTQGRWPSNLVLSHLHTCRQVGTQTVEAPTINRFTDGMKPFGDGAGHPYESSGGGTEEQAVYECDPECPVRKLDEQSGPSSGSFRAGVARPRAQGWRKMEGRDPERSPAPSGVTDAPDNYGDQGGASRFFATFEPTYDVPFIYTGKASKADKNADLDDLPVRAQHEIGEQTVSTQSNRRCRTCGEVKFGQPHCECETPDWEETRGSKSGNFHPTVKSQALMTYLVRLVTPKGGIVLDPFAGSGSTCVAAITEGMKFIGIEREAEYHVLAKQRTDRALGRAETEAAQRGAFDMMDELPQE